MDSSIRILGDYITDIHIDTRIPKIIKDEVNKHANSKWNQLKPLIETQFNAYISEILYDTLTPVFKKLAFRNIFL